MKTFAQYATSFAIVCGILVAMAFVGYIEGL